MGEFRMERAVVVGASVAGLLAARVLNDHASEVVVVERDTLPTEAVRRPGVPQAAHVHSLLPGGGRELERLFPGLRAELEAAGAVVVDIAGDVAWSTPAGPGIRFPSSLGMACCTRELLEAVVRERVLQLPRVSLRDGVRVSGLLAGDAPDGGVGGLALEHGERLEADVVVDASGRASRFPAWLRAAGWQGPAETVVDADLGYASQLLRAPADAVPGARGAYVQVAPPGELRGGIALPVEGGRWHLTLVGTAGDHPPRDPEGFAAFAASLREPVLHDLLRAAEPAGPIAAFGATRNCYRHYERVALPAGLLVVGDAACALNPVYGQGMTAAAMSAAALERVLARDASPAAVTQRFPRALSRAVRAPWMLATLADLPVSGGQPSAGQRTVERYVRRVLVASTRSAAVRRRLLEVMTLTRPPRSLFGPAAALGATVFGGRRAQAVPVAAPQVEVAAGA